MTVQPKRDTYDEIAFATEQQLESALNVGGRERAKLHALAISEGAIRFLMDEFGPDYVAGKLYRAADDLAPQCKAGARDHLLRLASKAPPLVSTHASRPRRRNPRSRSRWFKAFWLGAYFMFLGSSLYLFYAAAIG